MVHSELYLEKLARGNIKCKQIGRFDKNNTIKNRPCGHLYDVMISLCAFEGMHAGVCAQTERATVEGDWEQ